jgi:cell division septal protein FtsQ
VAKRRSSKKKKKKRRSGGSSIAKLIPWKTLFGLFVCAAILAGVVFGLRYFFLNSRFFSVREIVVNKERGYSFTEGERKLKRLYMGQNIFAINLKQVQSMLKNSFPQLKKAEVRRNLPDQLEIDIISREPVAVIGSSGGIVIDREGVVLGRGEGSKKLIEVKGISFFLNAPARGERITNKTLDKALVLLNGLRKKMHRNVRNMEYVDVSDRNNILLGIYGVTVKMGNGDFSRKIDKLNELLRDPNINMKDINYIDLRFEDVVISPK